MPIYEYRCEKGHVLEVMQRMSDGPVEACTTCGASVQRVFHPIAVHFKGSGFYNTDYGKKGAKAGKEKSEAENNSSGSSDSDSGSKKESKESKDSSKDTKKKETKAPAASSSSDSKS